MKQRELQCGGRPSALKASAQGHASSNKSGPSTSSQAHTKECAHAHNTGFLLRNFGPFNKLSNASIISLLLRLISVWLFYLKNFLVSEKTSCYSLFYKIDVIAIFFPGMTIMTK